MNKIYRILIDVSLLILLPVLVVICWTGLLWHEWLGIVLAVAVVAHHVANPSFFRNLSKGKYNLARFLLVAVNVALLVDILFLLISGLSLSKIVMGWAGLKALRPDYPAYFGLMRYGHVCACFWAVVLMGIHLGQHSHQFFRMLKVHKLPKPVSFPLTAAVLAVAAYGNYVFVKYGWADMLSDPDRGVFRLLKGLGLADVHYLFDVCACIVFFAVIGHLLQKAAKK